MKESYLIVLISFCFFAFSFVSAQGPVAPIVSGVTTTVSLPSVILTPGRLSLFDVAVLTNTNGVPASLSLADSRALVGEAGASGLMSITSVLTFVAILPNNIGDDTLTPERLESLMKDIDNMREYKWLHEKCNDGKCAQPSKNFYTRFEVVPGTCASVMAGDIPDIPVNLKMAGGVRNGLKDWTLFQTRRSKQPVCLSCFPIGATKPTSCVPKDTDAGIKNPLRYSLAQIDDYGLCPKF